jgi:type II secretory ATPase GspE/PulE/Tfp pilus assembly ATPase PilB-like protein
VVVRNVISQDTEVEPDLFEMIKVTDAFREMINSGAATFVLRQKAIEQGMRTLREDGITFNF